MQITLIGKGRLGCAIANALGSSGHTIDFARLDRERGLTSNAERPATARTVVEAAVFCLVPQHPEGGSGWLGLFEGLQRQIENQHIQIGRVLFISSTAVYECVDKGWVDHQTPVHSVNLRTEGLLNAETAVRTLSEHTAIFRLTGLVGAGYHKYDPISFSQDRSRQAVDIDAVAKAVANYFAVGWQSHKTEVLTDGYIYYRGQRLDPHTHAKDIADLQSRFRLVKPSICAR